MFWLCTIIVGDDVGDAVRVNVGVGDEVDVGVALGVGVDADGRVGATTMTAVVVTGISDVKVEVGRLLDAREIARSVLEKSRLQVNQDSMAMANIKKTSAVTIHGSDFLNGSGCGGTALLAPDTPANGIAMGF